MGEADFLIIGAGSAGCVLARRLAEKYRVVLLEAGGLDDSPWLHVPIGYGRVFHDQTVNWRYVSAANPALDDRQIYIPRGKTLGGSSAINAMVYARGHAQDYDNWHATAKGWSWRDVEPIFRRMEHWQGKPHPARGVNGLLPVYDVTQDVHPLSRTYLEATQQIGLPHNPDYNRQTMHGACLYQITTQNGRRASSARAYLGKGVNRENLRIETHAHVQRIIIENGVALGIIYRQFAQIHHLRAKEVIVCAGAINSPHILELSGIGDGEILQQMGIAVQHHHQHVGQHLQDHLGVDCTYRTNVPTLNQALRPWYGKLSAALQYLFMRKGPLSLSLNQGGGFIREDGSDGIPEWQLYFSPVSYLRAPVGTRPLMTPDPFPGFLLGINACKPTSRGSVHLQTPHPEDAPAIRPEYLDTLHDREMIRKGLQLVRKIAAAPALSRLIEQEINPGEGEISDAALDRYIRRTCWTVFHQCGTCRMGDDPKSAVVDAHLRVHGIRNLRVVDASIFPEIPTANTNAPTIMVAEKASQHILADYQGL